MYEVKRYDGKGNLIEVISAKKCQDLFWNQFGVPPEITEEKIKENNQSHGMFHLITTFQRSRVKKKCEHCGVLFQPPRTKKAARYCFKPGVPEAQQCRKLAAREKTLKPKREVICAVCEKPFMTPKSNAKYCPDPQCNRNTLTVIQNAGGRYVKCHYCGFKFKASHTGNQKYCVMPYFVSELQCLTLAQDARKRDKLSKHLTR